MARMHTRTPGREHPTCPSPPTLCNHKRQKFQKCAWSCFKRLAGHWSLGKKTILLQLMIKFIPNGRAWLFKTESWPKYLKPEASSWLSRLYPWPCGSDVVGLFRLWILPYVILPSFPPSHPCSPLSSMLFSKVRSICLKIYIHGGCLIAPPSLMSLKKQTFFFHLEFPFNIGKLSFVVFNMSEETWASADVCP